MNEVKMFSALLGVYTLVFIAIFSMLLVGNAWGYTQKQKEAYAAAAAKAKIDRDYIVKQECSKQVAKKDQARCIQEVDEAYHRALKGWKEHYLGDKK